MVVGVGAPVRVHSRTGDDLGIAHVPAPVELGDVLELGHGPILLLRVVDLVEIRATLAARCARESVARADTRSLIGLASYLRIEERELEFRRNLLLVGRESLHRIFALEGAGVWEKTQSRFVDRVVGPRLNGRAWLILK